MRPHTVDANAINAFQQERKAEIKGPAHKALSKIFVDHCIALDEGGHCQQEWEECAGGSFPLDLKDWIADQMVHGRIRGFALGPNNIRNDLLKVGLPQKDHKWVRLAIGSEGRRIITDDIDFFDPKKKKATAKAKKKIKESASGPCSKLLSKKFNIDVFCLAKFCEND